MTTKYCIRQLSWLRNGFSRCGPVFLKIRNQSSCKIRKNRRIPAGLSELSHAQRESLRGPDSRFIYFSCARPPWVFGALRARAAALARKRSIWPRGRVTQISPIHSSFTPFIGLALKLVRLTREGDFPRSIVFRYHSPVFSLTAASSP